MSACIIPVAPNFQDPPSTPDSPPYLSNFNPKFGFVASVPVPDGLVFSASVSDPNLNEKVYVRWALDYPPYVKGNTVDTQNPVSPANDQSINAAPITELVDCVFVNGSMPTPDGKHRLELIVANRPFSQTNLNPDTIYDSIDDPTGFVVRASWTFVISCPAITSSTSSTAGSQ